MSLPNPEADDVDAPSIWRVRLARWGPLYAVGVVLNVPLVLWSGQILSHVPYASFGYALLGILFVPPALVTAAVARFFGLSGWRGLLLAYVTIAFVGVGAALFELLLYL